MGISVQIAPLCAAQYTRCIIITERMFGSPSNGRHCPTVAANSLRSEDPGGGGADDVAVAGVVEGAAFAVGGRVSGKTAKFNADTTAVAAATK